MSYSFNVRAPNKAEAKAMVNAKMDETVVSQPVHAKDCAQAKAAAATFIDLLTEDESKDVSVSMNGYLSGNWVGNDIERINGASVSISAGHAEKPAVATAS